MADQRQCNWWGRIRYICNVAAIVGVSLFVLACSDNAPKQGDTDLLTGEYIRGEGTSSSRGDTAGTDSSGSSSSDSTKNSTAGESAPSTDNRTGSTSSPGIDAPSVALVGGFSIAIAEIDRTDNEAIVHFVISKVDASGAKVQHLVFALGDDHDNWYEETLTLDLGGAPEDVVSNTPIGFSYVESVSIRIPAQAPVRTIQFSGGAPVAIEDVRFAAFDVSGRPENATIDMGDVAFEEAYLTVVADQLVEASTGWRLRLNIANVEYNSRGLDFSFGVQMQDGGMRWRPEGIWTDEVPGSGNTTRLPKIWSISDAVDGTIPANVLLYFHVPSSSEDRFVVLPLTYQHFPLLPERIVFGCTSNIWTGRSICEPEEADGLYVMTAEGSFRTRIATKAEHADWAPDGISLFTSSGYVMNGDGQDRIQRLDGWVEYLAYSWDGQWIAYSDREGLQIMRPDGSERREFYTHRIKYPMTWSPDGTRIVYGQYICGQCPLQLYEVVVDGPGKEQPVDLSLGQTDPAFSPDGTKMAFVIKSGNPRITTGAPHDRFTLMVRNTDGSGETELVHGRRPAWSPDSTRIAFNWENAIFVINVDGSNLRRLGPGQNPSWAPPLELTADGLLAVVSPMSDQSASAPTREPSALLWRLPVDNITTNPLIVVDGVVYFGSGGGPDSHVNAVDATTGELLWRFDTDQSVYGAPTVADGVVYVGSDDNYFYALDSSTGNLVWRAYQDGEESFPVVPDGVVYVSPGDGYPYALDASTGELLWQTDTDADAWVWFTQHLMVVDGLVYIGSRGEGLHALDASTGKLIRRYGPSSEWERERERGPLAFAGGVFYAVSGVSDNVILAIDARTGVELWRYEATDYPYNPMLTDGVLYVVDNGSSIATQARSVYPGPYYLYAIEASTGGLLWQHEAEDFLDPILTVADGVIYGFSFGDSLDHLYALEASTGGLLWRYEIDLPDNADAAPAVADGVVYFGTDDYLYALSISTNN